MTQSLRSKSKYAYDSLATQKKRGNPYGKEKNEIMEKNIISSLSYIYTIFNICNKKFYNNF